MLSVVLVWDTESIGHSDTQQLCSISVNWQDVLNIMASAILHKWGFSAPWRAQEGSLSETSHGWVGAGVCFKQWLLDILYICEINLESYCLRPIMPNESKGEKKIVQLFFLFLLDTSHSPDLDEICDLTQFRSNYGAAHYSWNERWDGDITPQKQGLIGCAETKQRCEQVANTAAEEQGWCMAGLSEYPFTQWALRRQW